MVKKIPNIGYRILFSDILSGFTGFFSKSYTNNFQEILSEYAQSKHIYLTSSGISAFYVVLQALKKRSSRREVILSGYTAPSLVVAIHKAGLKPVLCDISLEDFNMDTKTVRGMVSTETLCIVCVHMFGIPVKNIEHLKNELSNDVCLIEDCAQAMGSQMNSDLVGSFGDVSVFSFNRGKNLPAYGGGGIFTDSDELAADLDTIANDLKVPGLMHEMALYVKFMCLSIVFKPFLYTLLYPFVARFKEDKVPVDFPIRAYTSLQARLGMSLFKRFDESCKNRYENAMTIINGLRNTGGIMLPEIHNTIVPAFNRLPVVFKDLKRRERVEVNLWHAGIETSRMYFKPLHHIFDLGYGKDDFPHATYFAEHMLTLPIHPLLTDSDLNKIIKTITATF
jgi:dTDP-4-amino-4,6-dideoxygalactose transaminase